MIGFEWLENEIWIIIVHSNMEIKQWVTIYL